jgi:hypothetical protein
MVFSFADGGAYDVEQIDYRLGIDVAHALA